MITTNLGFPRIGRNRELKRAIESYWSGRTDRAELSKKCRALMIGHWRRQADAGIDLVPCNDFATYDHVLDHVVMFGAIPPRFGWRGGPVDLDTSFALARGSEDTPPLELTKWFNTNYHYLSTELTGSFELTGNLPLQAWQAAHDELGLNAKPVLIGPYTFLKLANNPSDLDLGRLMERLLPLYAAVLRELAEAGVHWVQVDEPWLVTDVAQDELALVEAAYRELASGPRPKLMLQTYFDDIAPRWECIAGLPVDGLGIDVVSGRENLAALDRHGLPGGKHLMLGIVDGRNVWRSDLDAALATIERVSAHVAADRLQLGPSCSLLHLPITTALERQLDPTVRSWLAYAEERLEELTTLRDAATGNGGGAVAASLADNRALMASLKGDSRRTCQDVSRRVESLTDAHYDRATPARQRRALQQARLKLPPLPTTTIGSFPQTREVRLARSRFRRGDITAEEYESFLDGQFRKVIALQEELGLDVLVHGEFERSDMVDYFAERLDGMAFTEAWVQSFGTRCVRPPLIFGDVSRPRSMTVQTAVRVQKLTIRPLKGMLTGPVTMLMWSYPRDDVPRKLIATQLALAIRDEVQDLESAGIGVIQIDEPAFREGLPLQRADREAYLEWATEVFRLASSGVAPETQIHTHMCYSEFNDIMPAIHKMGADVISIESSRSSGELLAAFRDFEYDRGIGPGVYDVHSTRVPDVAEMADLIRCSAEVLDPALLWVNPDCGLKTRGYEEIVPALRNMVAAARRVRTELFGADEQRPARQPTS